MNKKTFYEAPEAEILVVKYEENLMASYGEDGKAGTLGTGNVYDFDDDEE